MERARSDFGGAGIGLSNIVLIINSVGRVKGRTCPILGLVYHAHPYLQRQLALHKHLAVVCLERIGHHSVNGYWSGVGDSVSVFPPAYLEEIEETASHIDYVVEYYEHYVDDWRQVVVIYRAVVYPVETDHRSEDAGLIENHDTVLDANHPAPGKDRVEQPLMSKKNLQLLIQRP